MLCNVYDILKVLLVVKVIKKLVVLVNFDKVVKICVCCFCEIVVCNGMMVYYGYQCIGWGFQIDSCLGFYYLLFEVFDVGFCVMIEQFKNYIVCCNIWFDNVEVVISLIKILCGCKGVLGCNFVVI